MTVPATIVNERKGFFAYRDFSPEIVERLASEFRLAEPFSHLVFENFLNLTPAQMADVYPAPDSPYWKKRRDFYQSGKMYCRDTDIIPPLISSMFYELSAPPFLRFLESVSGSVPPGSRSDHRRRHRNSRWLFRIAVVPAPRGTRLGLDGNAHQLL